MNLFLYDSLDALIMAADLTKTGKMDRSAASFEEVECLFGVKPDVYSYNGLHMALAYSYQIHMYECLSVYRQRSRFPSQFSD